ncbi:hypothetical protein QOZ80_6BG0474240 [Eleusine coracana subsp. coracana]|nr:hypothetical protein QOZ80_6BG0474240 [Eleusine coracana subsp. coracana]
MEGSNLRDVVDKEAVMEMGKAAGIGLAGGSVWGGLVAMLYDGPPVGSNVKYPELIRAAKVSGKYAATASVLGATYIGIEQALEKYRRKKDFVNGSVAGFAAGATAMGFAAGSFRTGLRSGCALALTVALLHVTGMKDDEEEHH